MDGEPVEKKGKADDHVDDIPMPLSGWKNQVIKIPLHAVSIHEKMHNGRVYCLPCMQYIDNIFDGPTSLRKLQQYLNNAIPSSNIPWQRMVLNFAIKNPYVQISKVQFIQEGIPNDGGIFGTTSQSTQQFIYSWDVGNSCPGAIYTIYYRGAAGEPRQAAIASKSVNSVTIHPYQPTNSQAAFNQNSFLYTFSDRLSPAVECDFQGMYVQWRPPSEYGIPLMLDRSDDNAAPVSGFGYDQYGAGICAIGYPVSGGENPAPVNIPEENIMNANPYCMNSGNMEIIQSGDEKRYNISDGTGFMSVRNWAPGAQRPHRIYLRYERKIINGLEESQPIYMSPSGGSPVGSTPVWNGFSSMPSGSRAYKGQAEVSWANNLSNSAKGPRMKFFSLAPQYNRAGQEILYTANMRIDKGCDLLLTLGEDCSQSDALDISSNSWTHDRNSTVVPPGMMLDGYFGSSTGAITNMQITPSAYFLN